MHARSARRAAIAATVIAIGLFATQAARAGAIITPGDNIIDYTGAIVDYTVQTAGLYDITATGGNGGDGYVGSRGSGITLGGDFTLAANQIIEIAVGGGGGGFLAGAGGAAAVLSLRIMARRRSSLPAAAAVEVTRPQVLMPRWARIQVPVSAGPVRDMRAAAVARVLVKTARPTLRLTLVAASILRKGCRAASVLMQTAALAAAAGTATMAAVAVAATTVAPASAIAAVPAARPTSRPA